jgi:hypothetical protein
VRLVEGAAAGIGDSRAAVADDGDVLHDANSLNFRRTRRSCRTGVRGCAPHVLKIRRQIVRVFAEGDCASCPTDAFRATAVLHRKRHWPVAKSGPTAIEDCSIVQKPFTDEKNQALKQWFEY